jgi:hypothetical protein
VNRWLLLGTGALVVVLGFVVGLALGSRGGTSGSPSTAPRPSASAVDSGLVDLLPTSVYDGCVASPGGTATCTPTEPGVDELLVRRYPSADALRSHFATSYGSKPDGKCGSYRGTPATGYRSTWGGEQPLACYVNSNGAAVVLWDHVAQGIEVIAVRKDGDAKAAFAWWTQAVKTPLRS